MITNYPICLCMILCSLAWLSCEQSSNLSERGYQYLLHTQSEGPKPQPGEYAYFDIVMKAGDSILNTSYNMEQRPRLRMPFQEEYTSNTPALIDGLKLMSVGDSLTLFFPLDSMDVTPVAFEQYDVIEYKLKMADIKTDAQFKEEMQKTIEEKEARLRVVKARGPEVAEFSSQILDQYNAGKLSGIITTESGLKYVVHEDGSGKVPQPNDMVSVHYYGLLMNGLAFDNSFSQGEPYKFPLGQGRVIQGWDLAIANLREGSKASLIIPPALGYGEAGYMDIPGRAHLYFYVELEKTN